MAMTFFSITPWLTSKAKDIDIKQYIYMFIYTYTYINYLLFALLGPNLILFVNYILIQMTWASLVAQRVKNPPAV